MRIYLFALLPLMVVSLEVEKAPTARGMGPPDSDLLNPVRPKGKRKRADEETDDYNDVETQPIKNKDNGGLKSVTYAPITQAYDIPKYADVSTLSPIAEQYLQSQKSRGGSGVAGGNGGRVNQPRNGWSPAQERRKGYYFMHYPWNMLPKAYRIRPSYQFYYPTQYQNTVYSYPSNPYSDPYGVYRQLIPCGSPGGYCGYQGYGGSGCGGGSCRGGCGGGGSAGGSAGGCGDSTGYSGDNDSEETEEGDEDETTGGKSGETKINKADPLDDLDLEDLEKLDKDKGEELGKKKMAKPYEPPPDYPMVEEPWHRNPREYNVHREDAYRLPPSPHFDPILHERRLRRCPEAFRQQPPSPMMLRTRQYPEVAGIFGCEEQPALRRFTRYQHEPPPQQIMISNTEFSKSSKKPSFFNGAWTFREKKPSRPPLQRNNHDPFRREERPLSMHCDVRVSRSRSETANRPPIQVPRKEFNLAPSLPVQPPPISAPQKDFTTRITVEETPILRSKEGKEERRSIQSSLRKSCPELENAGKMVIEPKKRARRAKEKAREARWSAKEIRDWSLDDVLLWLQHLQLDDVASILIGYDMRGEDLLKWDDECLAQLGISNVETRSKILKELRELQQRGPQKRPQRTLFDLVRSTAYDQVLAVETPLTPRDITVCSGRMGCLQITKVNGSNLPLREGDCLLEINECAGEQFKSALMLTRLITASRGEPLRFVLLRRHSTQHSEDSSNETSSGVSSSPRLSE